MGKINYNSIIQSNPVHNWILDELYPIGQDITEEEYNRRRNIMEEGYTPDAKQDITTGSDQSIPMSGCRNRSEVRQETIRHEVVIRTLDHGYLVGIGCKKIAIESPKKLCELLLRYLEAPELTQQQFYEGGIDAIKRLDPHPEPKQATKTPPKDGRRKSNK